MTDPSDREIRTILVVDDQEDLLFLLTTALQNEGYRVLSADSGEEALRLVRDYPQTVDLLLTDIVMPGMNGRELAEAVQVQYPGLQVLYMSGFEYRILFPKGEADPAIAFLAKPFNVTTLVQRVRLLEERQRV